MKLYQVSGGLCILMLLNNVSAGQLLKSIAEVIQSRPNLSNNLAINNDVNQWDNDVLGLIDQETYGRETAIATAEQKVDITFQLSHEE